MHPIKIIKNRSDIGAGTRGSDLGVDAIEIAAINRNSDYFNRLPFADVQTHNEAIYDKVVTTFAKRIYHVRTQCERVREAIEDTLKSEHFPIVLSGDHSSALGTMSGIKAHFEEERMGVVWIDAHADLHTPYTTPSGNVHGMPLAAAFGLDNIENQVNEVSPETEKDWKRMKNIGIPGPKLKTSDLIYLGVRDIEMAEKQLMKELRLKNYMVDEVRSKGIEKVMEEAIEQLSNCEIIYISFDVDSMDCDLVSRGTGTPVPHGFTPDEVKQIIKRFINTGKVVCLEITEVNPLLDKENTMAETAFEILDEVTSTIEEIQASRTSH